MPDIYLNKCLFSLSYIIVEKISRVHNSNARHTMRNVIEQRRGKRDIGSPYGCSVVRASDRKVLGSIPVQGCMPWLWLYL